MWCSESHSALEELIRAAEPTVPPTSAFRHQVLSEALMARQRGEWAQRIQSVIATVLAATVLLCLPAYYHGLRAGRHSEPVMATVDDGYGTSLSRVGLAAMAVAAPVQSIDGFEWNLIQAEFAVRDRSLRAFTGAL